jgi:hypothetical protein
MSHYETAFGTDWGTLGREEAVERAYALGVGEAMGEYDREEYERVRAEMDSAYQKSLVDLAFEEGRTEGKEVRVEADDDDEPWRALVEGETVTVDPDDVPTGGRNALPEALDGVDVLDRPTPGEAEAVDKPDFLEK